MGAPESGAPRHRAGGARRFLALGLAGLLAAAAGTAGWVVSDALEANDDFCNACHLRDGVPLHIDLRRDFDARPPSTLAALHGDSEVAGRPGSPEFRCIDCHGGVGALGRLRVKALAAKDAFWYVVGHFDEPTGMRWPLLDADCRQCHDAFERKGDGLGGPAFHDLSVHNVRLGVACVECHLAHESGGDRSAWFLHGAHVRRHCARCHPEYGTPDPSEEGR